MLYGVDVAVCSEVNTKEINAVWEEHNFLSFKPVGAQNQQNLLLLSERQTRKVCKYSTKQ